MHAPHFLAVVEDNRELRVDLVEFLQMRGFVAQGFDSAEAFFAAWPARPFDLLLLDVALPGASGLEIAQRVRRADAAVAIVMLTALDANHDHLQGLQAGADVYLSKRSSLEVIEASCRRLFQRRQAEHPAPAPALEQTPHWRLNVRQWRLHAPDGAALELTHAEVLLLAALFACPGDSVAREALLPRQGKRETPSGLRNLDNTVSRLKRKVLAACGSELPLRPSYGKGYTFTGPCRVEA